MREGLTRAILGAQSRRRECRTRDRPENDATAGLLGPRPAALVSHKATTPAREVNGYPHTGGVDRETSGTPPTPTDRRPASPQPQTASTPSGGASTLTGDPAGPLPHEAAAPLGHLGDAVEIAAVGRSRVAPGEDVRAHRRYWDAAAEDYQATNGSFLGSGQPRFVWGPEGLDEDDLHLLGPRESLAGKRVLEVGSGAAQAGRWLAAAGADVVGIDISIEQLRRAGPVTGGRLTLVQADAARLPLADDSVDLACSAFGAVPFMVDSAQAMREVARVLRPGGRWVFSVAHPFRWVFPDDPAAETLTVFQSYFDRTPYVETGTDGRPAYVEPHRTMGDRVREIVGAGLVLEDLVEPQWPDRQRRTWGQWSPERGSLLPGTAIFVCALPPAGSTAPA
jgi:SAM-dependent methyltransferase